MGFSHDIMNYQTLYLCFYMLDFLKVWKLCLVESTHSSHQHDPTSAKDIGLSC